MLLKHSLDLYEPTQQSRKGSDGTIESYPSDPTHGGVRGRAFIRNLPRALEKVGGKEEIRYDSGFYIPLNFDVGENWRIGFDGDKYEIVGLYESTHFWKLATLKITEG